MQRTLFASDELAVIVAALPLANLQQTAERTIPADRRPDPASSHLDLCAALLVDQEATRRELGAA